MQPLPLSHPGLPGDLVLLAAERTVTVTREEHHQDVLGSRTGPTIAELQPCTITAGKHAGRDGLEVVLDGRRVGELTRLIGAALPADGRGGQVTRVPSRVRGRAGGRRAGDPGRAAPAVGHRASGDRATDGADHDSGPIRCVAVAGSAGDRRLPRRSPAAQASTGVDPRCPRPVRAGALRRPGSAGRRPAAVPPPARGVGCGCRSAGARLGAGLRLTGRAARRQLVGAAVCHGTGGARCGRAEPRDDERRAGRSGGRTRSTLDGTGAATRTRDVEADGVQVHDVQAHDVQVHGVQACTSDRSGGPGARRRSPSGSRRAATRTRRLCPDRQ